MDFGLFELARSRSDIKKAAEECLAKMEYTEDGIAMVGKLAADLELKVLKNSTVKELGPGTEKFQLTDTQTGALYFDGKKGIVIYDETRTYEEKQFTVAHEIGHYMLRHWETLSTLEWMIERLKDLKSAVSEMEADLFAEYLLGRCRTEVSQVSKEVQDAARE